MTAEKRAAVEKIQKLLALAKRPGTPAEGEAALARAHALAGKHGLTIRKSTPKRKVFDDIFDLGPDWFTLYSDLVDRGNVEATIRKAKSEAKRKATVYRKTFNLGWHAAQDGVSIYENPYDKHVWGVDLPGAWKAGHHAYREGRSKA